MPQTPLLANETVLMTARFHGFIYYRVFLSLLAAAIMIGGYYLYVSYSGLFFLGAAGSLFIAACAFKTVWSARSTELSITNMRVIYTEGRQRPVVFRTEKIDLLHVKESTIGRWFGFATFQVRAPGHAVEVRTAAITVGGQSGKHGYPLPLTA